MLSALARCVRERRLPSSVSQQYLKLYRAWGERELRRRGYLEFLKQRPAESFPAVYEDLWFLYRLVRKRRPRVVLELGAGCSTVILGYALRDNGSGILHSVDTDPYWVAKAEESLPDELRSIVKVTYSPVDDTELHGTPGRRHAVIPNVTPDLLYLDAPHLSPERSVAFDPLDLEERFPPGFAMVVDGRPTNVEFLRRHFRRAYRIVPRPLFNNTVFELRS